MGETFLLELTEEEKLIADLGKPKLGDTKYSYECENTRKQRI